MGRPRVRHALLLLPLVIVAVWLTQRARAVRDDPADVLRALRAAHGPMLPAAGTAGASARTETSAYDRETLYEYIDGAAESYLARGFERCLVATYTFTGTAGSALDITAEVYRFAAPGGAKEQMLAERPNAATPLPGIADAFVDPSTLVAIRGRDYLKLTALASGAEKALVGIAAAWAGEQP
ncbi:MAG: hypothetical protein A2Y78_04910 [Acidobacteria bacterium RBG_13_68_16]|jgi:hypothetical protein|nr:MAG: hypothetical protein A2Y78_04910 [Acidobacteria bacterium RBG_13_68_16]